MVAVLEKAQAMTLNDEVVGEEDEQGAVGLIPVEELLDELTLSDDKPSEPLILPPGAPSAPAVDFSDL